MPLLRTAAAALAATFFTVLVTAHPAAAATSATVTPDTGLVDGQTVTVDGVGYTPGATIGICQGITDGLPLVDNCGTGATAVAFAGPTGDVTSPFDVRRVIFVASLGRDVDCLAEGCEIRISEIPSFAGAAFVPISFAAVPPTSTPLVTTLTGYREVDETGQPSAGDLDGIGGARITFPIPPPCASRSRPRPSSSRRWPRTSTTRSEDRTGPSSSRWHHPMPVARPRGASPPTPASWPTSPRTPTSTT